MVVAEDDFTDFMEFDESEDLRDDLMALDPWCLLVVDDEEDIHAVTRLTLGATPILGRHLEILSAYSAAEAEVLLQKRSDIAVILLDVVMERDDAGLTLVRVIREQMKNRLVRIILRTGQPGHAPELDVVQVYDINDYKAKTELTRTQLLTSVTAAFRAYTQLRVLEAARRGLERIITASRNLFSPESKVMFADGVLTQLAGLLETKGEGILLTGIDNADPDGQEGTVLAAVGDFAGSVGQSVGELPQDSARQALKLAVNRGESIFARDYCVLFIETPTESSLAIYMETTRPLLELEKKLLTVFAVNVGIGFNNVALFEKLRRLAYRDVLTGLPNRAGCRQIIDEYVRKNRQVALTIIDLDGFNAINDGLGGDVGDKLLQNVAVRMCTAVDGKADVSRLYSDNFALIHDVAKGPEVIAAVRSILAEPVIVDEMCIPISATHGSSTIMSARVDSDMLIKRAGMALKKAKNLHRGSGVEFTEAIEEELKSHLQMVWRMKPAIEERHFFLEYQPQINLNSREFVGAEALIRWRLPEGGIISPAMFIPAAEHSGYIVPIGYWVVEEACKTLVEWQKRGVENIRLGINLSGRQMKEAGLVETITRIVREAGASPRNLELEITETVVMDDIEHTIGLLKAFKAEGFTLSIDDFGTGYSSLNYLQHLPVDTIKIDKSFVTGIETNPDLRKIASLITSLGHELGHHIIAEGIESKAEEKVLIELGCNEAQGFLYSRPIDGEKFAQLVLGNVGS